MFFEYVIVFAIAALAGAWSLFVGVLLGLDPIGVYVAGLAGSLAWTTLVLLAGGAATDRLLERFPSKTMERIRTGRARRLLARWGEPGLALIGSVVLGPTITLGAALVLQVDRRRFAIWYYAGTIVGFALITAFWALIFD